MDFQSSASQPPSIATNLQEASFLFQASLKPDPITFQLAGSSALSVQLFRLESFALQSSIPFAIMLFWMPFLGTLVIKLLLLIVIGFVVWGVTRAYLRSLRKPPESTSQKSVESMVKCAHCAVNLPRSEAIYSGGEFYCTPEHQKLGKS